MQATPHNATAAPDARHARVVSSEIDDDENNCTLQPPVMATAKPHSAPFQVKRLRSELSLEHVSSNPDGLASKPPPSKRSNKEQTQSHPSAAHSTLFIRNNDSQPSLSVPTTDPSTQRVLSSVSLPSEPPLDRPSHTTVENRPANHIYPKPDFVPATTSRTPQIFGNAHNPDPALDDSLLDSIHNSPGVDPVTTTAVNLTTPSSTSRQSQAPPCTIYSRSTLLQPRSSPCVSTTPTNPPATGPPLLKAAAEKPPAITDITDTPHDAPRAAASVHNMNRRYSDPLLVNIAPLDSSDNVGWDRFVFFAHYPRRFDFGYNVYISALSPFSGITLHLHDPQPSNVCAICGAASGLRSCPRCKLGFHSICVNRSRNPRGFLYCVACANTAVDSSSSQWRSNASPPTLPPPESALPRLIADVQQGNPIDLILIPSLLNFYVSNAGSDWLRCYKCKNVRIICGAAIAESVRIPFDCSQAFWDPEPLRNCDSASTMSVVERCKVEEYLTKRSRTKIAMRYFMLGEEDRADFGLKEINCELEGTQWRSKSYVDEKGARVSEARRNDVNDRFLRPGPGGDSGYANGDRMQLRTPSGRAEGILSLDPNVKSRNLNRMFAANGPDASVSTPFVYENRLAVIRDGQGEIPNRINGSLDSSMGSNVVVGLPRNNNGEHRKGKEDHSEVKVRLLQDIGEMNFDAAVEDALMELALAGNEQLMSLYIALGRFPDHMERFKRQAILLASRSKVHPRMIRNTTVQHVSPGLVANRTLSSPMKNGTNVANSLSFMGVGQRRIRLGESFKDFRLRQLRSELQLCSNVANELAETTPQHLAAAHVHTYRQIVAMRAEHDEEIRTYLERLASVSVIQHRSGTLQQATQVHQRQKSRHLHGVPTLKHDHIGRQG